MMLTFTPTILALDFDGVLCDGLLEYFQTAWRAYCQIWQPPDEVPPDGLAALFYRLRPVVEIGWEMPVLIAALQRGIAESEILQHWHTIAQQIVVEEQLKPADLGYQVDHLRDQWIAADLDNWLSLHRFYPGVIEKLQQVMASPVKPIIITTKEGRFVRQLLQQQGIELAAEQILGKEYKKPKHQTLRELLAASHPSPIIWFIEDRLKTLLSVQEQSDLKAVQLYLADWGYNTLAERQSVSQHLPIQLLSLAQFSQDFTTWPR